MASTRGLASTHGLSASELPAEIRFLLDTVAAGLGGPAPRPNPDLARASLLACVRHHRLAPLIGPALAPEAGLPEDWRRALTAMQRKATLRSMRVAGELARIARRFAQAGVEVLALKGPALSMLLYRDPCRRACRDIDLLVRPGDEAEARRILARCGYGVTPDAVIPCINADTLLHVEYDILVELHVRLAEDERLLPSAALAPFDTAIRVEIAGTPVQTLGGAPALAYAAYHGARHHWFRLFWLADIAAAMDHPDIDWREVAALARRTGTERQLTLMVRLCGTLLGRDRSGLPAPTGRHLRGVLRAEAVLPDILALPPVGEVEGRLRVGQSRLLLSELAVQSRPGAWWATLMRRLRPTGADRAHVALPPWLDGLYYVVRLARAVRMEVTRGVRTPDRRR